MEITVSMKLQSLSVNDTNTLQVHCNDLNLLYSLRFNHGLTLTTGSFPLNCVPR